MNWFNPHDGIRAELISRRRGEDIVQEGTFPDGTPIRWTFSDITENSCRWRGERLEPDGKTCGYKSNFGHAAQDETSRSTGWTPCVPCQTIKKGELVLRLDCDSDELGYDLDRV